MKNAKLFLVLTLFMRAGYCEQGPNLFEELSADPSIVLDTDATLNELPPLSNAPTLPQGMKSTKTQVLPHADSARQPASSLLPPISRVANEENTSTPKAAEAAVIPAPAPQPAPLVVAPSSVPIPQVSPVLIPPQPQLAGVPAPAAPAPVMPATAVPTISRQVPETTVMPPLPGVPDVAIILAGKQFFPSRVRLKDGVATRLIFSTVNRKPAALVIERLQIQRWIAKEAEAGDTKNRKWEVTREVSSAKTIDITLDPKAGVYSFYDAISGASGEIEVE